MSEVNRLDNENFIDYCDRLISGKESGFYDLEKSEIWELLFNEKISTDEARKRLYGVKAMVSKMQTEGCRNLTEQEIIDKITSRQIEAEKEKYKVQALRTDLNRIVRETSRTELLIEEFINSIKKYGNIPSPEFKELQIQKTNKEYVLSFADVHFGKEFTSITNFYNMEVVYERFNKLFNETLEIIEECGIEHLTILSLGDMIEGSCLRISQMQSLQIGIVDQTVEFMRFIASWLNKLSEYVNITYYQTIYSNHSQIRPFGTKANDFVNEDMEKIIYAYVHDMLENNPRITVVDNKSKYIIFKIFKYNIIACHGHDIKNLDDFIKDASEKYRIFFDYAYFAHKHSLGMKAVGEGFTNNCEVINVPSIMGSDDYADSLFVGSKAGATLIEYTEQQGKRKIYDIILN